MLDGNQASDSVTTIYRPAIRPVKRGSSSENGPVPSCNEMVMLNLNDTNVDEFSPSSGDRSVNESSDKFINHVISEYRRRSYEKERRKRDDRSQSRHGYHDRQRDDYDLKDKGTERAYQAIREAEASKARILDVSGNHNNNDTPQD